MTTTAERTNTERTNLMGALACLDIDLEQELRQLRTERAKWEPGFLLSFLGSQPTPPPELAWTFPPATSADEISQTYNLTNNQTDETNPTDDKTEVVLPSAPTQANWEATPAPVAFVPPPEPASGSFLAGSLACVDAGEDETTDEVAQLLGAEAPVLAVPQRPSWSERLNRVFARRQAQPPVGASAVREEAVSDPWVETFPEPHQRFIPSRGVQYPVLGFALGLTAATLGTLGVVFLLNQQRPLPTNPAQLTVPAPPPENAVPPVPHAVPVPNLARKELPDLSAIPTASPQANPAPSPAPGFYYVVTDYQNEQSLIAAQRVVPEAFVWQFSSGVKVQLAAYEVREQAEQFVANLEARGLNARIYP